MSDTSEFDNATEVAPDGSARIVDGWDIGGNANGGYLLAMVARRMIAVAGRPDPITITGHYLSPGKPGPVQIDAAVVKAGRRFATVQASMRAGDTAILQVLGSFGDLAAMEGGPAYANGGPPALPPIEECRGRPRVQEATSVPLMDRIRVDLRPQDTGFAAGTPSGVAEVAGYFSFADGRALDPLALLLVCDCFPPAVFNLDITPGWVPTVEYTVHVRARPAPGPLRCVFRTRFVQNGCLEEESEVWDSAGTLVAQSRQLGLMPR